MLVCYLRFVYVKPCNDCIFETHFLHATNFFYISALYCKVLNTPCDKRLCDQQIGRKNIKELDDDLQCILLWRSRLLEEKDNVFTICSDHEQFFEKVFENNADKCCSILKSHCHNSKAHGVINLETAKILKEKGFSGVLHDQKLCRQCVTQYETST